MISTFLFAIVLAAAFFSAENLVVTIAGFIVSYLGTQVFKYKIGVQGAGSVVLAIAISILVALVGIEAAAFLGGNGLSWDELIKQSGQIFTLATLAFHVIRPDDEQE